MAGDSYGLGTAQGRITVNTDGLATAVAVARQAAQEIVAALNSINTAIKGADANPLAAAQKAMQAQLQQLQTAFNTFISFEREKTKQAKQESTERIKQAKNETDIQIANIKRLASERSRMLGGPDTLGRQRVGAQADSMLQVARRNMEAQKRLIQDAIKARDDALAKGDSLGAQRASQRAQSLETVMRRQAAQAAREINAMRVQARQEPVNQNLLTRTEQRQQTQAVMAGSRIRAREDAAAAREGEVDERTRLAERRARTQTILRANQQIARQEEQQERAAAQERRMRTQTILRANRQAAREEAQAEAADAREKRERTQTILRTNQQIAREAEQRETAAANEKRARTQAILRANRQAAREDSQAEQQEANEKRMRTQTIMRANQQAARESAAAEQQTANEKRMRTQAILRANRQAEKEDADAEAQRLRENQQRTQTILRANQLYARQQQQAERRQDTNLRGQATQQVRITTAGLDEAKSRLNELMARFKTAKVGLGIEVDTKPMEKQLDAARANLANLTNRLKHLQTEMASAPQTGAGLAPFIPQMKALEGEIQRTISGMKGLEAEVIGFESKAAKSFTGVAGFLQRLRRELEKVNEVGLGSNIQEISFRLAPLGIAAGAITARGIERAQTLEETQLSFEGLTGSEDKALEVMQQLTEEAQRFGRPVIETLTTMQRLAPLAAATGRDLSQFVGLAARLATMNPMQGMEGAVLAISEALSQTGNDFVSLAERFNIARKAVRAAVDESGGDIVKGLDLVLNRYGRTEELAVRFGETNRAAFTRAQDAINAFLAQAVRPLLDAMTPLIMTATNILNVFAEYANPISSIAGTAVAATAAFVALTFAIGQFAIAWEAMAATVLAAQIGGAISGIVGALGAIGGAVGLSGAAAVALPIVAVVGGVTLLSKAIHDMNESAIAARKEAIQPLVDRFEQLSHINVPIPNVPDANANAPKPEDAEFGDLSEQDRQNLHDTLVNSRAEAIRQYNELSMEAIGTARTFVDEIVNYVTQGTHAGEIGDALRAMAGTQFGDRLASDMETYGHPDYLTLTTASLEEITTFAELLMGEGNEVTIALQLLRDSMMQGAGEMTVAIDKIDQALDKFAQVEAKVRIEEIIEWQDDFAKNMQELGEYYDDFERDMARTFADRDREHRLEQEDFSLQRGRTMEDRYIEQDRAFADFMTQRNQMILDFNESMVELEAQAYKQREESNENFQEQEQKRWEDHLREMLRMARDVDYEIAARNFLAAQRQLQAMKDREEDFNTETKRRKDDLDKQLKDLEENLNDQRLQRQRAFDRQLRDYDNQYRLQQQRQEEDFNRRLAREDQDRQIRLQRQEDEYHIADQRRVDDYNLQLQRMIAHNETMALYQDMYYQMFEQNFLDHYYEIANLHPPQGTPATGTGGTTAPTAGGIATMFTGPFPDSQLPPALRTPTGPIADLFTGAFSDAQLPAALRSSALPGALDDLSGSATTAATKIEQMYAGIQDWALPDWLSGNTNILPWDANPDLWRGDTQSRTAPYEQPPTPAQQWEELLGDVRAFQRTQNMPDWAGVPQPPYRTDYGVRPDELIEQAAQRAAAQQRDMPDWAGIPQPKWLDGSGKISQKVLDDEVGGMLRRIPMQGTSREVGEAISDGIKRIPMQTNAAMVGGAVAKIIKDVPMSGATSTISSALGAIIRQVPMQDGVLFIASAFAAIIQQIPPDMIAGPIGNAIAGLIAQVPVQGIQVQGQQGGGAAPRGQGTPIDVQNALDDFYAAYYRGGRGGITPMPIDVPRYATGADFISQEGLAYLHYGERVMTAADNQTYGGIIDRGGWGSTTTVNIDLDVNVDGAGGDMEQLAERIVDMAEYRIVPRIYEEVSNANQRRRMNS